ncbi:LuxR family transcriptional regulator [Salinibacillus xinjiangensis]|uniref:NACHT domain-containing protein n=1 Tax=Salinibacillus xinjiangensis TaxID=1229268 RepID=A0A6G1X1C0_9BACI|nr:LuxR family transcriptional regulator [Salinibacillus xinjiangensis]MRG84752.1 NACHT domain-containing protein [Salinibacillus xinjiangensis]
MGNENWNKEKVLLTEQVHRTELELFVGRDDELHQLGELFALEPFPYRLIQLHGIAGVGKTLLIHKLQERLQLGSGEFFTIDCRKTSRIANLSSRSVLDVVKKLYRDDKVNQFIDFITKSDRKRILVIDHVDEHHEAEEWIRESVAHEVPEQVMIMVAGQTPLRGPWLNSPAWQQVTKKIELQKLSFLDVNQYVNKRGFLETSVSYKLWNATKGHPLALSLFTSRLIEEKNINLQEQFDLIQYMVEFFIEEVKHDRDLRALIEICTILHFFNEDNLSYIYQQPVSETMFDQVLETSFVKQGKNGWFVDNFIRQLLNQYFKHRNPRRFKDISKRCAAYYRHKIFSKPDQEYLILYISEFIYHLGDNMITASLYDQSSPVHYSLQSIDESNFDEVEQYFEDRKKQALHYEVDYYQLNSEEKYSFKVSKEHNQRENQLIDVSYLKQLGYDVFRIAKDHNGQMTGLSIVIPINRKTIPYLKEMPVTRSYFNRLAKAEMSEMMVDERETAGYFIRMIDVVDPKDPSRRSYLLYSLMPLLLSGGRIITSTPLKMYQDILKRFGFEQVKGATHFDYGPNVPSPTYMLDVRGPKLVAYLDQLAAQLEQGSGLELPRKSLPFSPREFEVAELIMEGYTNDEIASTLSVSQITVKKHVSNLLKKMEVKNRALLIRRLLDYVKNSN